MTRDFSVAVLGATGAVGRSLIELLEKRNFPTRHLKLFASERSAGQTIHFRNAEITIQNIAEFYNETFDTSFLCLNNQLVREHRSRILANSNKVIDNSSAFRMEPETPLIIPEVNLDDLNKDHSYVAVPNCSAIIMLMAVAPLRTLGKIERVIISTYQSASGGGAAMMDELIEQSHAHLQGNSIKPRITPFPYAFNLFSHNTPINDLGYNGEEWKVIEESRKILKQPNLGINVTCVRVPILRCHSESITVEFADRRPSVEEIQAVLQSASGIRLVDDPKNNHFPMPSEASKQCDVFVGRIRHDLSHAQAISLFVCGDQLYKGAALNAIQIGESMIDLGYL
jgi:aspartate-semialdehyde dehydrogenase